MVDIYFEWVPLVVGVVITYFLGWFWYTKSGFGDIWVKAQPHRSKSDYEGSMVAPLCSQVVWLIVLSVLVGHFIHSGTGILVTTIGLVALTIFGHISNGRFLGQHRNLILVDSTYRSLCVIIFALCYVFIG